MTISYKKPIIGENLNEATLELIEGLCAASIFGSMEHYEEEIFALPKEDLFYVREYLKHNRHDKIAEWVLDLECTLVERNAGFRNVPFADLPVADSEGRRIYLTGSEFVGRKRHALHIFNDYVLTDDEGRYIHTDEVLTREYLIDLDQDQIQGSAHNHRYIFLPMPRAEAIYKKLKAIEDKSQISSFCP